jgi:hypothetical protein
MPVREQGSDPLEKELNAARKKIGELSMENELLRVRCWSGSIAIYKWCQKSGKLSITI